MTGDTLRHQGMRNRLVQQLKAKGIRDINVLMAISKVPRHLFLDSSFEAFAYQDKAFPIGADQTISHPYTVAFQSENLACESGMKVLEVGTGSGYQCAVLLEMGCKVYTVERQKELFYASKILLTKMNYRPIMSYGDGYQGMPSYAPFDRIIITAAAPNIPEALLHQLKVGGHMIVPVGSEEEEQRMILLTKKTDRAIERRDLGAFRFVPMLEDREG
jgi:protein-L-isoaspartate(D-aspartate) O-methyltransferase